VPSRLSLGWGKEIITDGRGRGAAAGVTSDKGEWKDDVLQKNYTSSWDERRGHPNETEKVVVPMKGGFHVSSIH